MSWTKRLLTALFRRTRDTALQTPPERVASDLSDESLQNLEEMLGYAIRDPGLFAQALLHRSYHQRSTVALLSNERMEFLGDSVLNLIVGEDLYGEFSSLAEGVSGCPAAATKRRDSILSPISRIASGDGPIQRIPAASTASAKGAFSARNP